MLSAQVFKHDITHTSQSISSWSLSPKPHYTSYEKSRPCPTGSVLFWTQGFLPAERELSRGGVGGGRSTGSRTPVSGALGRGAPSMQHSPEPGASESPLDSADVAAARARPSPRPVVSSAVTTLLLALLSPTWRSKSSDSFNNLPMGS